MDAWAMADAIAYLLNEGHWQAKSDGLGEIAFTNEDGERFRIVVDEVEDEA